MFVYLFVFKVAQSSRQIVQTLVDHWMGAIESTCRQLVSQMTSLMIMIFYSPTSLADILCPVSNRWEPFDLSESSCFVSMASSGHKVSFKS